jgi:hypothetical protein
VIFSLVVTALGAAVLFAKEVEPLPQTESTTHGVEVSLRVVRMLPDRWEFELLAHNTRSQAVFILTEPVRTGGSKGSYFTLDPQDASVLDVAVQLYPPPNYCIYANLAGVTLKRLDRGATHVDPIILSFPAKETSPPYKGWGYETLDKSTLRTVRAAIGILPDDEGVRDFLRCKEGIGPYARGNELLENGPHTGQTLYEAQELSSTTLKL